MNTDKKKDLIVDSLLDTKRCYSSIEIARRLEHCGFTQDQSHAIAAEVYQPLRELIRLIITELNEE